jgi:hypothetical protein
VQSPGPLTLKNGPEVLVWAEFTKVAAGRAVTVAPSNVRLLSDQAAGVGYEATVWERTVDEGTHRTSRGLRHVMARQRAYSHPRSGNDELSSLCASDSED